MKLLISILIITITSFIGYLFTSNNVYRHKELIELRSQLNKLKDKMVSLRMNFLDAIFELSNENKCFEKFFMSIYYDLKNNYSATVSDVWIKNINILKKNKHFSESDIECIKDISNYLIANDINIIERNFKYISNKLDNCITGANEKKTKINNIPIKAGFMLGVAICVVFI